MPRNLFVSVMRTAVPVVVGVLLGLAAKAGLQLDDTTVTGWVTAACTALYYAGFRALEELAEKLSVPWLRTVAGVLLGWARPPQYVEPVIAPVRLKLDMGATEEEFARVLRRAEQRGRR